MPNVARDPREERVWEVYGTALGMRVKQARALHQLSQHELADAAGVSANTVKNIEKGLSSTKGLPGSTQLRTLFRIAGALGLPPTALLPALEAVPPSDPGGTVDLHWPADAAFDAAVQSHPLPETTERARRKR